MTQTSRERVIRALEFNGPDTIPRDLWVLPWMNDRYPAALRGVNERFPPDFQVIHDAYRPSPREHGSPFAIGTYVDEWGCTFHNVHGGIIGEVREPMLTDLSDRDRVEPPYETLPSDWSAARDHVNRQCGATDRYVRAGCNPRPWERLQFIRGTVDAMMDIMDPDAGVRELITRIHEFYLKEVEFWVTTDVDGVPFMDDWGSQTQLLVPPDQWRELFKPLYRDYCDLIHAHGKHAFMHSDGHIVEILPDLIEVGVDAINSQLFCMDLSEVSRVARGRVTFWGEIDRQHVLTSLDLDVGRRAVRELHDHLYLPEGGVIAQFELGPGSNPEMAQVIFEEWERLTTAI